MTSYRICWDRKGAPEVIEGNDYLPYHLLDNIIYTTRAQAKYAMRKRYELIYEIHGGLAGRPLQLIYKEVIKV